MTGRVAPHRGIELQASVGRAGTANFTEGLQAFLDKGQPRWA